MSFRGDIPSISLGDVIQNLAANQKTGTLTIRDGDKGRHIHFRSGKIVSYEEDGGLPLVELLLEKGVIPEKSREEVLRRHLKAKRKTLGEILHDMGLVNLKGYRAYLADVVKETLYEVLSLQEGTFSFRAEEARECPGDREIAGLCLELNALSIMMEAARRADDWQNVRRHIPSEHEIYVAPPGERERLLGDSEDEVTREAIDLLDGTRTIGQVIARHSASRFEACRALARLIAEKKVKALDSALVLQRATSKKDRKGEIACLKTVLEREPSNREILKRLAELCEAEKLTDESATYSKLLANSYLDEEDLGKAEECLRRSLRLNPKDIGTWQRLWDVIARQGKPEQTRAFGQELLRHFKKHGLLELARDHILGMIRLFPDDLRLKVELADARFALGDKQAAVQGLSDLGNELVRKNRLEEAERIFGILLKYDRNHPKAKEVFGKLRSGTLAVHRARRRQLVRNAILSGLFVTLVGYLVYELHVRAEFFQMTRAVFADGLLEEGRYDEAIRRVEAARKAYPYSITSTYKAPTLIEALRMRRETVSRGGEGQASQRTRLPAQKGGSGSADRSSP